MVFFIGKHITIVSFSRAMEAVMGAANQLASIGIEPEIINLRSLRPLDMETINTSIKKTNHLITVEQGWPSSGIGAEILAKVMESETFYYLDQPPIRLTSVDIPIPYALSLENASVPRPADIVNATKKLLNVK